MPDCLTISLSTEELDSGSPEELATFGIFAIAANDSLLTEGIDTQCKRLCHGPYVPGYPIAEWLAWNWWRIRWELGRPSEDNALSRWEFSHRMTSIGEGYSWPNITIYSDGLRSFLNSDPSVKQDGVLFRYFGSHGRHIVSCIDLESAVDAFVEDILNRLQQQNLTKTNLRRIWSELQEERGNTQIARFRRLEAQLGCDPDEADEDMIYHLLESAAALGEEAFGEMAADTAFHGQDLSTIRSAREIHDLANAIGFDTNLTDTIKVRSISELQKTGEIEAWRLGESAAKLVRNQERLDGEPIADELLAEYAGTMRDVVSEKSRHSQDMSFVFDPKKGNARVALRPKWETGRRFELARLIGDRLINDQANGANERLFPATRTYSYRQKMQRAFAAELLSPFASVDAMLSGDYSEERQNEVAQYFIVSPMTIQTQLLNRGRISQDQAPNVIGRGAVM